MSDLREANENTVRCKQCGWIIVPTKGEPERDVCFCCANTIPLFKPCPHCEGKGWIAVHVCENESDCKKRCPVPQACMGCLGTGWAK